MTQEEKARAYDEALDKIKSLYEQAKQDGNPIWSTYEYLIPELAESEDERIRKEILNYVLYKADGVSEEDEHRWVTWLEKQKEPENVSASTMIPSCWEVEQKEQKPAELGGENKEEVEDLPQLVVAELGKYVGGDYWKSPWALDSTGISYPLYFAKLGAKWQKEQKPNFDTYWENGSMVCKQKEQNPYEPKNWPADKDNLTQEQKPVKYGDDVVEEAEEYTSKVDCGEYGVEVTEAYIAGVLAERNRKPAEWSEEDELMMKAVIGILDESDHPKLCHWLKSLKPQPKQEWSEEDEEIFNNIIEKAKGGHWIEVNEITWLITHFKSLRPQPRQEWNEEDELKRDNLIGLIEEIKRQPLKRLEDWDGYINWLKSLKPSWKPSKEQMDVLFNAGNGNYLNGTHMQILKNLYNDLKKLM